MFQDLDLTLHDLLKDATVPPPLAGVDVSFKRPDKVVSFDDPTINLFLFNVRENRVLRDPVPILAFVGGQFVRRRPPLRVDCDYLVTTWSKKTLDAAVEEEHLLLAQAFHKLSRYQVVPSAALKGTLAGQPFPVQLWVAQEEDGKSLAEFWSSLGTSPRASFHLMATIAMDLAVDEVEGPPVTTREIVLDDDLDETTPGESIFAIGGVVRDAGTTLPVAEATVTVDGGRWATTDAEGTFRLAGLAAGSHTLTAVAAGFATVNQVIIVPAPVIDAYDIDL
ncbi:MAG: Pvc16 family protein [Chloroflexota bacterium]|nr:Pvc16 family protein [Chloroflexota bacterium]